MQFVFLRPEICLQLPPHPASRRRGCCSARGSRSPGSPEDLHLQVTSRLTFAAGFLLTSSALSAPRLSLRAMPGARLFRPKAGHQTSAHGLAPELLLIPAKPGTQLARTANGPPDVSGFHVKRGRGGFSPGILFYAELLFCNAPFVCCFTFAVL